MTSTARAPSVSAAAPASSHGQHVPALDALRGVAISMVLFFHFINKAHETWGEDRSLAGRSLWEIHEFGAYGVDVFFVLSGFLITGILFDSKSSSHYFRNFYIRRTLRIFPLYYVTLFLSLILLPALSLAWAREMAPARQHALWLWTYTCNILVAKQGWVIGPLSHFWSLAIEEQFYLFWPVAIWLWNRRAGMLFCVACIAAALVCRWGWVFTHRINYFGGQYVLTPCRMDCLALGGFLALAMRGPRKPRYLLTWARWSVPFAVAWLLAARWWHLGHKLLVLVHWFPVAERQRVVPHIGDDLLRIIVQPSMHAWLFGAVLILALHAPSSSLIGRCADSRLLRCLGKYSYALYVFHWLLATQWAQLFPIDWLPASIPLWFVYPLFFVWGTMLTLALAWLSWHLWEKHFLTLKDVLAKPASQAPMPVP